MLFRTLSAGEIVLNEDFDKLDLKALPTGYSTFRGEFAIIPDATRGKVLKISQRGGDDPELSMQLDLNKVAGHNLRIVAFVRVPVALKPVDGKPDGVPQLKFITKDHEGTDKVLTKVPASDNKEWQRLSLLAAVDKDSAMACVNLTLNLAAGEVQFGTVSVEIDPDTRQEQLAEAASKAPARKMDMGGVAFGPDVAEAMQKGHEKSKATPGVMMFAGPGLPIPELDGKPPAGWTAKTAKELDATPRTLLAVLPEAIGRDKPEIVYLIGDGNPTRKPPGLERIDWEDLAKVCLRLGAVPVLVVPVGVNNEEKDVVRAAMLHAADVVHCPVMELGAAGGATSARIGDLAMLAAKHIFGRDSKDAPDDKTHGGAGKVRDE